MIDFPKLIIKENSLKKFLKTNQSISNINWLVSFSIPLIFIIMFIFFGKHLRFFIFVIYVFPWIILNICYLIIWIDGNECGNLKKLEIKTNFADICEIFFCFIVFRFLHGSKWSGFLGIPFLICEVFNYLKGCSSYYWCFDRPINYIFYLGGLIFTLLDCFQGCFLYEGNAGLEFLIFFYCIISLDLYFREQFFFYRCDLCDKPFKSMKIGFRLWWTAKRNPLFIEQDFVQNFLILLRLSVIILLVFFRINKSF
jgi:hypothetical protein